ncbi:hypothetical protein E0L01_05675 [Megamonas funiformis]|nr:hypothetical protein [Megamonas funiformis]
MTEMTIILTLGATTVSSTTTLNMEGIMDRIKIADIDNERYYQVPVAFFTNPYYKDLSNDSKLAYAILKNRLILSIKNNWLDNDGAVYIFYTQDKLSEIMNISKRTITNVINQLKENNLIDVVQQGRGLPAKIYVKKLKPNTNASKNDFIESNNKQDTIDEIKEEKQVKEKSKTENKQQEYFSIFWASYPKKVGKGAAEKSWKKIKPTKDLLEKMLNAIETAKQSMQWNKDNGQYIPNPATWLNQKRWEDEIIIDNKYSNKSKNSNNMPSAMTTAQKALDLLEQMGG